MMLKNEKMKLIQELVSGLNREEIIWLNGYLAGVVSVEAQPANGVSAGTAAPSVNKITITYGTESGNAKKLATTFAAKAKKNGIQSKVIGLDQYRLTDLPKEEWFFTIISTQGEGEPPASAKKFYDHLHQDAASLSKLKYGVLALGDTSYPLFCKAGEDVDEQLQRLGATRVVPLQKLDTDYESEADQWFSSLLQSLNQTASPAATVTVVPSVKKAGKQVYNGLVLTNINLNATGSLKETYHLEIEAEDVVYEAGDALGFVPQNDWAIVSKIISLAGVNADALIAYKNEEYTITDLLRKKVSVAHLSARVIKKYSEIVKQEIPDTRMDLLDLLRIYPVAGSEQFVSFLEMLDPITPRLYSIASSPAAHTGEVHLTVSKHNFLSNGQVKTGLCSDYLAQVKTGDPLPFYIHKNHLFKLPAADKDIIMIGPGTGIAPFRSFVAERDAAGAEGRSWLFFGEQHFTTDFLYQTEWQNWLSTGSLTKMNVAFSRDQDEKIYVQHKLLKHAAELFEWIEGGAYIFVCGAKDPMSVDVENTLKEIIKKQKNISAEEAAQYLEGLSEAGRYVKDVY